MFRQLLIHSLTVCCTIFLTALPIPGISAINPIFESTDTMQKASVDISIQVQYGTHPVSLSLDNNFIMKTAADGFSEKQEKAADRYRVIGSAYLNWHAKSAYEIIMYTDNIHELGFSFLLSESLSTSNKIARVGFFSGLMPKELIDLSLQGIIPTKIVPGIPFKVWVPLTAGTGETTAPASSNGIISETAWKNSFFAVPEKSAVHADVGSYGSYKKVIASIRTNKTYDTIEMTFGLDLNNANFQKNAQIFPDQIYKGKVYIELIGN